MSKKPDKLSKVERASKEFSRVVDDTSKFIKSVFPHGYSFILRLRGKVKKKK